MQGKKVTEYWDGFYGRGLAPTEPTDFCEFVMGLELEALQAVDLGCGNGRDSDRLAEIYATVGIDPSCPRKDGGPTFVRKPIMECLDTVAKAGLVYSRFLLHSVSDAEIDSILDATTGYFAAETRVAGDVPKLYTDHERNLLDPQLLLIKAIAKGYRIIFYSVGRGMAEYMGEDPLVARIILKRN